MYDPRANDKTPGPGQYDRNKESMNENGKFFISKYNDSRCRSFSKSAENGVKKSELKVPGPGAYNYYSEFGMKSKIL